MMDLPESVLPLIEALKTISGIQAVVLGGSRARGTHVPGSDVDLGLYYDSDLPLDVSALDSLVSHIDDRRQPGLVTPIGGWGPNINGGGWLRINGIQVDLLYRDLGTVQKAVADCIEGRLEISYQPGHPFGFLNSILSAEVALCQPFWERQGQLTALKAQLQEYPVKLKQAMLEKFTWEIRFGIEIAEKAAPRRDLAYIAGSLFRSVECICLVLFALNGNYWMNEKGAVDLAGGFPLAPADFKARVDVIFVRLGEGETGIRAAIDQADQLRIEVNALVEKRSG